MKTVVRIHLTRSGTHKTHSRVIETSDHQVRWHADKLLVTTVADGVTTQFILEARDVERIERFDGHGDPGGVKQVA